MIVTLLNIKIFVGFVKKVETLVSIELKVKEKNY